MSLEEFSDGGILRSYEEDETQDREDQPREAQTEHKALPGQVIQALDT